MNPTKAMITSRLLLLTALLASLIYSGSATVDEKIVTLSLRAMELVEKLRDKSKDGLPDATLYKDDSDAALLVKENGYCFAIFDTTEALSLEDWMKNIDTASEEICVLGGGPCCMARRGYQRAYTKPDYRASLDVAIIDCFGEGYDIVLAGHSAGGAIASVAAVALGEMNPLLLTFGQPASIVGDCDVIDEDKYYHWMNTDVNGGGDNLDYDPVPDLTLTAGAKKYGQLILMGEDRSNVVCYKSGNAPSMMSWGFDVWAHSSNFYLERMNGYQGRGDLSTKGWDIGFACNVDEECRSGTCGDSSYWRSGTCKT